MNDNIFELASSDGAIIINLFLKEQSENNSGRIYKVVIYHDS